MRRTPAEFARVKIRFPQWYIQRTLPLAAIPGYTAIELATGRRIRCASLAELEDQLAQKRQNGLPGLRRNGLRPTLRPHQSRVCPAPGCRFGAAPATAPPPGEIWVNPARDRIRRGRQKAGGRAWGARPAPGSFRGGTDTTHTCPTGTGPLAVLNA
jgi:hypothetical protein